MAGFQDPPRASGRRDHTATQLDRDRAGEFLQPRWARVVPHRLLSWPGNAGLRPRGHDNTFVTFLPLGFSVIVPRRVEV